MLLRTNWLSAALRPPRRVHLPTPPVFYSTQRRDDHLDETQLAAARQWLARFNDETIPRSIGEVTFSRSSGPGGQNVNKSVVQSS